MNNKGDKPTVEKRRLMYQAIKERRYTKRKELAEYLNVKERTITNYISYLKKHYGLIIENDPSDYTYKIIDEGYYWKYDYNYSQEKTALTERQVSIILSALASSRPAMPTEIGIIMGNLYRMLSKEERKRLEKLYHFDGDKNKDDQFVIYTMDSIREAINRSRKIMITYKNAAGKISKKILSPYSFASDFGKYYLIAKLDNEDKLKNYRVDRIRNVDILEVSLDPNKLNIDEYLKKAWYMYTEEEVDIVVKFKDKAYAVVNERNMKIGKKLFAEDLKEYGIDQIEEGYFYYKFTALGTKGIRLWLLGFGCEAEIISPNELREEVKRIAQGMVEVYGCDK
jgi:predicted DNA-binding transcriptional regulator YafY